MEALIAAVFICVVVFVGGAVKRAERSARRSVRREVSRAFKLNPPQQPKPPPTRPARSPASTAGQPSVFNATRADKPPGQKEISGFAHVVDGDTITINKTQIRLFGIDAPEMNHPYGKKAKWALVSLCKGKRIRAEITAMDDYGRTVAKCFLPDGKDLSEEMVKNGMAIDWAKFSGGVYRRFEQADVRKKLWLADARQKGRMHVWEQFEAKRGARSGAG